MKKKHFITITIALILFSLILISSQDIYSADLKKGKNTLYINISQPIYAKTLIKLNPCIEVISFKENNQTIGYINIYNGLGENFVVEQREYEVIVSKDTNLILPE